MHLYFPRNRECKWVTFKTPSSKEGKRSSTNGVVTCNSLSVKKSGVSIVNEGGDKVLLHDVDDSNVSTGLIFVDNFPNELDDDVKLCNDIDERLQKSLEVHLRSIVFAGLSVGTNDDNG